MGMTHDPNGYAVRNPESLTVSDVERLAKAGVKIEFKEIAQQVIPDPLKEYSPQQRRLESSPMLMQPLIDRLTRAGVIRDPALSDEGLSFDGRRYEQLAATQNGDKVYVFYARHEFEPIMLEDDATMFPSDALIAKFLLWKKEHPNK